ncbi:MAG: hypothetical protein R3D61_11010 [Defluviimonas denitrificans]
MAPAGAVLFVARIMWRRIQVGCRTWACPSSEASLSQLFDHLARV